MISIPKLFIGTALLGLTISAHACKPPDIEYEPKFEPGSATLTAREVIRLAEWHLKTQEYRAGFKAYVTIWQNKYAGISHDLAKRRGAELQKILKTLGVPPSDIAELKIRENDQRLAKADADEFFNQQSISIEPRCPHVCCGGPHLVPIQH